MDFNSVIDTMTVHVHMTEYGDALIYGHDGLQRPLQGIVLKQRLFAWDETSYYGTELAVQQAGDTEIVLLPAEQVLPFFANGAWPVHIEWHWNEDATQLQRLAPLLIGCLRAGHYAPDLQSFRNGSLHWSPDPKALRPSERSLVKELRVKRQEVEQQDSGFAQGILAAFSASVFHKYYGTQGKQQIFAVIIRHCSQQRVCGKVWMSRLGSLILVGQQRPCHSDHFCSCWSPSSRAK